MAEAETTLEVEVVYALPGRQTLLRLRAPAPLTAREAVLGSGVLEQHPEIDPAALRLGVFGRECDADRQLEDGDRVEIYRPLLMDPREARRRLAAAGGTMGQGATMVQQAEPAAAGGAAEDQKSNRPARRG